VTDELPPADLLSLISLAGSAIDRRVLEDLHAAGFGSVRPAHGYLIQRLLTGPQLVTVMAADLGVTQQAVSKMAKELVRLGIAEQQIDGADSRRRPLTLSAQGRAGVERARAIRAELEQRLATAVGAADLVAAQRVVTILLDQLGLADHLANRTIPPPPDE
jgi:DNA-binding MarR family transcriptional regulator